MALKHASATSSERAESIWAVVPVFQPPEKLTENLRALAQQVDTVLVVDDGHRGDDQVQRVLAALQPVANVRVLRSFGNHGIATALNRGIDIAVADGATVVVTVDQDTLIPPGYVDDLLAELRRQQAAGRDTWVACAERMGDVRVPQIRDCGGAPCSVFPVQSGLVFDVEVFARHGVFRSDFVIDGVEQEFLLRLHEAGSHVTVVPGTVLPHQVGEATTTEIAGRSVTSSNHSVVRRYYMWRNTLWILRRYAASEPEACGLLRSWLRRGTAVAVLAGPHRLTMARWMLRGARDFRRGRFGPVNER